MKTGEQAVVSVNAFLLMTQSFCSEYRFRQPGRVAERAKGS